MHPISILQSIFQDKLIVDDRSPIFTFTIPLPSSYHAHGSSSFSDQQTNEELLNSMTLGICPLKIIFWIQVLAIVAISGIICCFMWGITYYFIIPSRKRGGRGRSMVPCFLVGFGVVCPILVIFPLYVLHALDVQNKVIRFCFSAIYPIVSLFHTIEAMYGFSPQGVEESFKHYALYNACVLPIQYEIDPKTDKKQPVKASMKDVLSILKTFVKYLIIGGCYMSLFAPTFEPYDTPADGNQAGFDFEHLTDWNLFRNNIVSTLLFQMVLSTFTIALSGLAGALFGVKVQDAMKNPVFESTSVSDFWGNRWNLIIHGALKRGVFKPVYKYFNRGLAVLATFVASGLFHEYLLWVIFAGKGSEDIEISFGKNTAFMVWNAVAVTLEYVFGGMFVFQWAKTRLPKPLITCFVLSSALPIAHWFIHPYSKTGFFEDLQIAFPMIRRIS